jgi:hypothetical protein
MTSVFTRTRYSMILPRCSLLRMRNVPKKFVEVIETHIMRSAKFFRKIVHLRSHVEGYGTDVQATDDNRIRPMLFSCWLRKAADTQSEHVTGVALSR